MLFETKSVRGNVKLGTFKLEQVEEFKYLGATATNTRDRIVQIREKI